MPKRIDRLTNAQKARMDEWADRWIEIGLRTGPADRERFEAAARECCRYAGIEWPSAVVWVPSPLVLALAAPAAAFTIEVLDRLTAGLEPRGAVDGAVGDAVGDAVGGAVSGAVSGAVDGAVSGAVDDAVSGAVDESEIGRGALEAIKRGWTNYIGGQLWIGGWRWGGAFTSFFREICHLELNGDLWDRGMAYEATMQSACWWWPHRRFVMVSERPLVIHRELADPTLPRGWGSHRLHCADGPAIVWPDGWGVWAFHGVRVPQQVIERPESLDPQAILAEPNAEVRRVMIERYGYDRLLRTTKAHRVNEDDCGILWRIDLADDEPLVAVEVLNSTPEPDGSIRQYVLRVPPDTKTARAAVAWTFGMRPTEYAPKVQT